MKRFHVHLHVDDLAGSIGFYSKLFAAEPARVEADYAKWMVDDPPLNFAISTRGARPGIDHLGFQADNPAELAELRARAESADLAVLDEGTTTCCYAQSEKHWVTDPQGIAWEHFRTLAGIPLFRDGAAAEPSASACCAPRAAESTSPGATVNRPASDTAKPRGRPVGIAVKSQSSCC
jgi:catechol 2,3-dioxygenase-like lactoylglutathione lyase family enzyme